MNYIFSLLTDLNFILFVFIGSVAGLIIGSMPGLSVTMATAILVSFTYTWNIKYALATIMGIYVVGVFSGSISAILLNIPGAPSNIVTTIDGNKMAKDGRGIYAIKACAFYSFIGSIFGFVSLLILIKPISKIAIMFTPLDYFLIAIMGLSSIALLTKKSLLKTFISALIGIFISLIGYDSITGVARFTFGIDELNAGIGLIPALIGIFGLSEAIKRMVHMREASEYKQKKETVSIKEFFKHLKDSVYYSIYGTLIGALPGAGSPVASLIAYSHAKKKNIEIGNGKVEGLVASESANNACIGGALIPLLSLGIPGDAVTAVILSVFYIHGLNPGPTFLKTNIDSFYTITVSGLIACVFLFILGTYLAPKMTFLLKINRRVLSVTIALICIFGAYSYNNRLFDVLVMIIFGVASYLLSKKDMPLAPIVLGIVLGKMIDLNLRRTIALANASTNVFSELIFRPITMAILITLVVSIVFKWRKDGIN